MPHSSPRTSPRTSSRGCRHWRLAPVRDEVMEGGRLQPGSDQYRLRRPAGLCHHGRHQPGRSDRSYALVAARRSSAHDREHTTRPERWSRHITTTRRPDQRRPRPRCSSALLRVCVTAPQHGGYARRARRRAEQGPRFGNGRQRAGRLVPAPWPGAAPWPGPCGPDPGRARRPIREGAAGRAPASAAGPRQVPGPHPGREPGRPPAPGRAGSGSRLRRRPQRGQVGREPGVPRAGRHQPR